MGETEDDISLVHYLVWDSLCILVILGEYIQQ